MDPLFSRSLLGALICALWLGCGTDAAKQPDGGSSTKSKDAGAHAAVDASDDSDAGKAPKPCVDDTDCDDGVYCNGVELCLPKLPTTRVRACVQGSAPVCDDGIGCTKDRCEEAKKNCVFTPVDHDGDGDPDAQCLDKAGRALGRDCDDRNEQINIFATDVCDSIDNDCDGKTDEMVALLQYPDEDHDGRGDSHAKGVHRCAGTAGYSVYNDDCDDTNDQVAPFKLESCDSLDNDCDGLLDEACQ